jgi:hypothetical protein
MNKSLALFALVGFVAVSGFISSCATVVEEANGPTVEKKLPYPSNHSVVTVTGRKGATQQFLAVTPPNAEASVILFAGDTGHLGLDETGSFHRLNGNFLIKNRRYFVEQGMMIAVVDTPSDRSSLDHFRTSRAHAVDIRAVINWLRKRADVPVWLVGTSRGTISVAGVAGQLATGGPDGIVLTSTLFGPSRRRGTVYRANLDAIKVPVLIVHHKGDACKATAYRGTATFMKRVSTASKSELITIQGGTGNIGNPCGPRSHHGYLGQERKVVKLITDWIKAN